MEEEEEFDLRACKSLSLLPPFPHPLPAVFPRRQEGERKGGRRRKGKIRVLIILFNTWQGPARLPAEQSRAEHSAGKWRDLKGFKASLREGRERGWGGRDGRDLCGLSVLTHTIPHKHS